MAKIDSWGALGIGAYRVRAAGLAAIDAAAARLARESGLSVCGGPRLEYYSDDGDVYSVTLGERMRDGYRPQGTASFRVMEAR